MREPFQGGWYECPVCRKQFRIPAETAAWTYVLKRKGRPIYLCSWGCVRKEEKAVDRKTENAPRLVRHAAGHVDESAG